MSLDTLVTSMTTGPGFTAAIDVPRIAGRVSAVIATYNRCPFDPASARLRDNPLTWALDSLLAQAGHALAEIVIADDGSSDYTQAVLHTYLTRHGEVPVRCIRLDEHRGAWAARNAAARAAAAGGCYSGTTTASSHPTTPSAPPTSWTGCVTVTLPPRR